MSTSWNILSKYRNELYGFSIIWIMMFHMVEIKHNVLPKILNNFHPLLVKGYLGVEIFLLLSGMSLYYAYTKKSMLRVFYKNRLKRVLVPLLLITGVYCLVCNYLLGDNIVLFVKNITFYSFWHDGNRLVWFLALLTPLYLLYPLFYKYFLTNKMLIVGLCLMAGLLFGLKHGDYSYYHKVEIALTRIPIFLLGCYIGKLSFNNEEIKPIYKILCVVLAVAAVCVFYHKDFAVYNFKHYRVLGFLFAVPIAVCVANALYFINYEGLNKVLRFIGSMSLELYLTHVILGDIIIKTDIWKNSDNGIVLYFGAVFIGALIISYILSRYVEPKIYERLSKWNI